MAQTFQIYRPEIWQPKIDRKFKEKLSLTRFFSDFSDAVLEGGRTVLIPHDALYTATAVTTTTGDIVGNLVTDTMTRLDIDKWYKASMVKADFQAAQIGKQYRVKEIYAENMAHSIAKKLEQDIIALFTAANFSRVVNASTAGLKGSDLEAAIGIAESYNIPREEMIFFLHPKAYYGEVLGVQKLYDASSFGKPSLIQGTHDVLYGVPVVVSSLVGASNASIEGGKHRNMLVHARAIAFAIGNLPGGSTAGVRLQEKTSEHLRVHIVADIVYGVKKVGDSYRGVRLISKN
jgi:hypothetical protein